MNFRVCIVLFLAAILDPRQCLSKSAIYDTVYGLGGQDDRQAFSDNLYWGFGESQYNLPTESDGFASACLDTLQAYGRNVLIMWTAVVESCGIDNGNTTMAHLQHYSPQCLRSLKICGVRMPLMMNQAKVNAERFTVTEPLEFHGTTSAIRVGRGELNAVLRHHLDSLTALLNRTNIVIREGIKLQSARLVSAVLKDLSNGVRVRLQLFRWHVTYYLFFEVFRATQQAESLPELFFHEYCCSNGEVTFQISANAGLLKPKLDSDGWGATIVEVGVETGEASRDLLARLPSFVRLVGVDPFMYNSTGEVELSKEEQWERQKYPFRYKTEFLQKQMANVKDLYAASEPPGQATLLVRASPEASHDPIFEKSGVDLVFIDGDHSEWAVRRDLDAWLELLQKPRHSRPCQRRVLAGHDYTFMFPGVMTGVNEVARRLSNTSLSKVGSLHLAANAVWWLSL